MNNLEKWLDEHPIIKRIGIIVVVSSILCLAWYIFLSIIKTPPIETTPAMIMIWISVAVIIFTFFPSLLNKVKKIKFKDFELELQETITKATSVNYLSISEGPDYHVANKSNFKDFVKLFTLARRNPDRPLLLIVNIRTGRYISIPALFIYLYFLDLFNSNIICLFIKRKSRYNNWKEINKDEIIGVIDGKKTLQTLLNHFPNLIRLITQDEIPIFEDINLFNKDRLTNYFRMIYENRRELGFDRNEFLDTEDVRNIFFANLNEEGINFDTKEEDKKHILDSIIRDEDYLIVYREGKLHSIIPLAFLTEDITKKVLTNFLKDIHK